MFYVLYLIYSQGVLSRMSEVAALTSSHVESEMTLLAQHQAELSEVHATHSLAAQQNMHALSSSITVGQNARR